MFSTTIFRPGVACIGLMFAIGCGRGGAERFTPPNAVARASLTAALDSWKQGDVPGTIETVSPSVQFVDNERPAGQKLLDYAVLSEVPGNTGRTFLVRLKLAQPAAEERVRFIAVGIDPIWIFRKADLDQLSHWEHPMPDPAEEAAEQP